MTMDQEDRDLATAVTLASSVAVIDSYSKVLQSNLAAFTMSTEPEERKMSMELAREAIGGLLWEVKLLRFLRERPDQVSPGLL
jgi:hypothetical protein